MNSLELNKELRIFVTNVEVEDDAYLKIWGQLDKNAVRSVEKMLCPLEKYFATSRGLVGIPVANLRSNTLCCAKFEPIGYCRTRILRLLADGTVALRLIDYGTIKVLQPHDVHLLDNIQDVECLHSYPPLAYNFTLMDVLPPKIVWDKNIIDTIKNTLCQYEFKITIHSMVHNYRFIKLQYHNEDFAELLVKRGMAMGATLPEMLSRIQGKRQVPLYQHPNKRGMGSNCSPIAPTQNVIMNTISSDGNPFHQNVIPCCAIQQKHLSQPAPIQEALVFKSRVLDVGSKLDVTVSFVEDGPRKFSVQLDSTAKKLSALMMDMNNHPVEPLREPPIPGSVCMGRYTGDKVLCRAVVMSVAEDVCKVYYVDFGHTEILPYTDIYQLPPHFIKPKVFSIRFTLSGVKELNVTEEMIEFFKKVVFSTLLRLHVRPPEGPPLVQYGDLYKDGKNVKDILRQAFPSPTPPIASMSTYQEPQALSKSMEELVYVSFVESCNKFFVQLDSSAKALESVMDCLAEYCKTAPAINAMQMRPGFPCAALYENQWYRAQILNVTGDNIRVLYIDYGNEETVNIMSLRLIHDDLVRKLQAQAIKCILHGREMFMRHKNASVQFELLTLEKRFLMKVVDVHSDGVIIDLYDIENMEDMKGRLMRTISDTKAVTSPNYPEERSYVPKINNPQVSPSNTTDEWQKKTSPTSWSSPDDNMYSQEKSKTKSFKDELNEERRYDMRTDKSNTGRPDPRNDRFNRNDSQYNTRNSREKWNNKFEPNDSPPFNKSGRSPRGGKTRTSGYSGKQNHSSASEKSFSDKDSDVSSRSGSRRGRGNFSRGGSSRRDGSSADMHSNKWNDRDSDGGGGFRSGKGNSDSYGGNKYKERRGQGYRIARNKTSDNNTFGMGMSDTETDHNFRPSSSFGGANEEASHGKAAGSSKAVKYDYAPANSKWTVPTYDLGSVRKVIVTWFVNPSNFFCQNLDKENEFRTMMNEIQRMYIGRDPIPSHQLQAGSPVIALFSDDGALYRAEVIEPNKPGGHLVQYIDFGNTSVVSPQKIYAVETKLMHLPKQGVQCSLKDVTPVKGDTWANINSKEIYDCFNADKYECTFHDITSGRYIISLSDNGNDIARTLVNKNLATFPQSEPIAVETVVKEAVSKPLITNDVQRIDINLLSGQALRVKVSSVESASKFYIQLPSARESENIVDTFMSNNDPKVMQQLSAREMCLGTGCLICTHGVWRRAVIIGRSESGGFDVKLIDTGENDEIVSDSVLALPGELAVMQNQAIECILQDAPPSFADNKNLKDIVEGKDAILYIEEVDNNRLITKLFDLCGNKISNTGDADEKICTVCPMPMLTSTHKVSVSFADHSASVWLQRHSEYELDVGLAQALQQHYSNPGKVIEPRIGDVCAAKSADGNWYRARIIDCSEGGAVVNFIDYGNSEEINFNSLMELDSHFYTPHQLAINVSLPVTLNCSETDQLSILQSYLWNRELTAVFNNVNKKWIAELIYEGEKISEKIRRINLELKETSTKLSRSEIQNIEQGCKYEVYVSHVDSPGQFWIQCTDEADDLVKNQDKLQSDASALPVVDGILEEGTLCIAVYSIDNMWYRAQVLDADEDITTLRFIDYGNTDVIDSKSGKIKYMSDSWKEIKEYAVRCKLNVAPIDSEEWSEEVCTKFQNLVNSDESIQALIVANSSPKRVNLFINDKSISDTLVEEKCAIMMMNEDALIDEIIDVELDPHSAFVSHINSPSEFWVQEEKSVSDLEIMSDRFMVADMFPKVDEIKKGMLCVAKYPEDKQWYRGRIISIEDKSILVLYIDYGNSAISTEIRQIPEDLAIVPALSRKCCLVTPDGIPEWSERACDEFIKLAADGATIFLLDVLREEETSLVKLTLDGQNVADILAEFCEHYPPITEERLPPLGEENLPNVIICRVNTLEDFWIQTQNDLDELDVMADRLSDAENFLPLTTFETGSLCAAKFSQDALWYRARILSHSESDVEVLYIDYGNTDVTTEIRILPEDIAKIPPLARRCTLQMPDKNETWPAEALDKFIDFANDESVLYQLKILDTNDPSLIKLSRHGQDISEMLCSQCENAPTLSEVPTTVEPRASEDTEVISKNETENPTSCIEESITHEKEDIEENERDSVAHNNYEGPNSGDLTQSVVENAECTQETVDIDEYESQTDVKLDLMNERASQVNESVSSVNTNEATSTDEQDDKNTVKELTVDDIVQNMERNADTTINEEEVIEIDTNFESKDDVENSNNTSTSTKEEGTSSLTDKNVENAEVLHTKVNVINVEDDAITSESKSFSDEKLTSGEETDIICKLDSACGAEQSDTTFNADEPETIEKSEDSVPIALNSEEPDAVTKLSHDGTTNADNLSTLALDSDTDTDYSESTCEKQSFELRAETVTESFAEETQAEGEETDVGLSSVETPALKVDSSDLKVNTPILEIDTQTLKVETAIENKSEEVDNTTPENISVTLNEGS